MQHGHRSTGVDGNMCFLMNEEIVAWSRADNPEVIDERLVSLSVLERHLKAGILRHPRRLILIAGGFAGARDTLRLKMSRSTKVVAVDSKRDQRVQRAA